MCRWHGWHAGIQSQVWLGLLRARSNSCRTGQLLQNLAFRPSGRIPLQLLAAEVLAIASLASTECSHSFVVQRRATQGWSPDSIKVLQESLRWPCLSLQAKAEHATQTQIFT